MTGLHSRHQLLGNANRSPGADAQDFRLMAAHAGPLKQKVALPKLTVSSSKPFSFTPQRFDWCTLHGVDLELLAKHCDITALERCLEAGLAHGDLEAEDPSRLTLTNLLRVARLSQMAIQYLLATQDGSSSKLRSLQEKLQEAEEKCSAAEAYSAEADERLQKQSQYLSTAKHKIVQLQKQMSQLSKDIKELQDINEQLSNSTGRLGELQNNVRALTAENDSLRDTAAAKDEHIEQLQHRIRQLEGLTFTGTTSVLPDSTETLNKLQQSLKEQSDQIEGLKNDLESSNKARQEQADKLSQADAERARLQQQLNDNTEISEEDRHRLQKILKRIGPLEKTVKLQEQEIHRLKAKMADGSRQAKMHMLKRQVRDLQESLASLRSKCDALESDAQETGRLRQQVQSLQQQLKDLQARLDEQKASSGWEDDRRKIVAKYNNLLERYQACEKRKRALARELQELKGGQEGIAAALQQVQKHNEALLEEQGRREREHKAEVDDLYRQIEEGNDRLEQVQRDMQLARQDMDNARQDINSAAEDMKHAETGFNQFMLRRPESAFSRRR